MQRLRGKDSNLEFQGQNLASCRLLHPGRVALKDSGGRSSKLVDEETFEIRPGIGKLVAASGQILTALDQGARRD